MRRALFCALSAALFCSCFQMIGKQLGDGLMQAVNDQAPSIGEGVVKGVGQGVRNDVLTDPTTEKLNKTVNDVVAKAVATAVTTAGETAVTELPKVREQAIGEPTREQLRAMLEELMIVAEARARHTTRGVVRDARDEVLSTETEAKLNALLEQLSTTARAQSALMRDDLLGKTTNKQVQVIVEGAMGAVVDGTERIRRQAHEELSFVQRNTAETMLVIGAVAAAIVAFFWRQKEKNRLLLNLLTRQMFELTEESQRKALLDGIRQKAHALGVDAQLKDALAQEGISRTGS